MLVYFIRRLGQASLVVFVMATLVFVSIYMVGNPVDVLANPNSDQREMAEITARLGLDKPLWEQYVLFVWNALHGDLGRSFVFNEPALKLILQRMPATMELALDRARLLRRARHSPGHARRPASPRAGSAARS